MKNTVYILFFLIVLGACSNPFPEYSKVDEGIYMKLISFDEDEKTFKTNKYVAAEINLYDNDQIIFKQYKEELQSPLDNSFSFLYKYLNEGDSAIFQVDTSIIRKECEQLKNVSFKKGFIKIEIKVHKYLRGIDSQVDPEMLEQILLKKYLKEIGINHSKRGIYIKQIKKGSGEPIEIGKTIRIHYKGYFVNRIEFDNTYKSMDFTFTYGSPGQVIKGLEKALKGMKKGEKAKIIIPSQLAFGEGGSSTKIIPPYTTVIYELEIVNVK